MAELGRKAAETRPLRSLPDSRLLESPLSFSDPRGRCIGRQLSEARSCAPRRCVSSVGAGLRAHRKWPNWGLGGPGHRDPQNCCFPVGPKTNHDQGTLKIGDPGQRSLESEAPERRHELVLLQVMR